MRLRKDDRLRKADGVRKVECLRKDDRVRRERVELNVPGSDYRLGVIRHGHYGRPVLVFPREGGRAEDFADNGMVSAVQWLVDEGRVTFFCVDSFEAGSGSGRSVSVQGPARSSVEDPAMRHSLYQGWLERAVVPAIFEILGGHEDIIAFGTSMGAYQAMQFAFQRADLAPLAIGLSGNYDGGTGHVWGERGMGRTSPTPPTMWPASTKTTWSGCASASQSCSCAVRGRGRLIPRVPCPRLGGSQSC